MRNAAPKIALRDDIGFFRNIVAELKGLLLVSNQTEDHLASQYTVPLLLTSLRLTL